MDCKQINTSDLETTRPGQQIFCSRSVYVQDEFEEELSALVDNENCSGNAHALSEGEVCSHRHACDSPKDANTATSRIRREKSLLKCRVGRNQIMIREGAKASSSDSGSSTNNGENNDLRRPFSSATPNLCDGLETSNSKWPPCRYGPFGAETPVDRLVGLTFHCVILCLVVMGTKLTRWASGVLKFFFYLTLHSAIYKGRVSVSDKFPL